MARFLSDLDTRLLDEQANLHRLLAPLVYESDLLAETLSVPVGFETDFASVPRLPLAYLMVGGKGCRAAVVHDFLYRDGSPPGPVRAFRNARMGDTPARLVADRVFREALAACGYGVFTRSLMYAGVRLGGGGYFRQVAK